MSRPTKSASLPVPTYTACRSIPPGGEAGARYGGCAEVSCNVLPPLVAVTAHGWTGSHTRSEMGNGCIRTSVSPACLNLSNSQWADSASAEEPVILPQYCG